MTKILIVDDHPLMRQGLKMFLADEWPSAELGEAGTAAEALNLIWKQRWDMVVLDINLPGRSGLEVLAETRQRYPKLPVLVLSSTPEDQLAIRVLRAGANGYLHKHAAPEELVNAVRKVMSGGRYVSAALAQRLAAEVGRADERPRHETLSDREYQVFQMMVAGKSVKGIAMELSLSAKTISTFRGRVFEKLGVRNDVELVRYAAEHGLGGEHASGLAARAGV
jgi:DNA-binding NarL/FixJ family response regulator